MANYGLTRSGFVRKRMRAVKELYENAKKMFGEDIDLSPETVMGMMLNIESERFAALWELIESVYSAMYPISATGANLDRAVSFTGVTRLQAEHSTVPVIFYGNAGVEIPNILQYAMQEHRFYIIQMKTHALIQIKPLMHGLS